MNILSVEFIVGKIIMFCSFTMLIPLILSIILSETDILALLLSSGITLIIGYSMTLHGKEEKNITNREAISVVCLTWIMLSFCGSFPYMFSGILSPLYSILESASGFSTVGTTLIYDLSLVPKSVLLWRSMTQWLGGMGIIVLFISFLNRYGTGAANLFNAELPGPSKEKVMPRISDMALLLWKIYTIMTITCAIIMYFCGLTAYDAITHSMTTIATGGFSTYNEGWRYFNNPTLEIVTAVFSLMAASSFYLYYQIYLRGINKLFTDIEYKTFITIIVLAITLITLNLIFQGGYPLDYALYNAFFHVAATSSTSGIIITDLSLWPPFSHFALILLMIIGGCASSTAGGLKISRLLILLKSSWAELKQILHPNMIRNIKLSGQTVNASSVAFATRFFFIFVVVYICCVGIITFFGVDVTDAFIIIASAIGTSGTDVAFSIIGQEKNFFMLNDFSKITIVLCTILGRLEFFTFLVLLRPDFWRKTRNW